MFSSTALAAIRAAVRRSMSGRCSEFFWLPLAVQPVSTFGAGDQTFDGSEILILGRIARVSIAPEDISTGADSRPLFKFIGYGLDSVFVPSIGDLIASGDYRELVNGLSSFGEKSTGGLFRVVRVEPSINNQYLAPVTCYVVLENTV